MEDALTLHLLQIPLILRCNLLVLLPTNLGKPAVEEAILELRANVFLPDRLRLLQTDALIGRP
jgi:hypothetical protein